MGIWAWTRISITFVALHETLQCREAAATLIWPEVIAFSVKNVRIVPQVLGGAKGLLCPRLSTSCLTICARNQYAGIRIVSRHQLLPCRMHCRAVRSPFRIHVDE